MRADLRLMVAAALVLGSALTPLCQGQAQGNELKTAQRKRAATATRNNLKDQVNVLRQALQAQEAQLDSLKTNLTEKDEQLRRVEAAASAAEASARRAEAALSDQNRAVVENSSAVSALQSSVSSLTASGAKLSNTFTEESSKLRKQIENPSVLRYKGMTFTPYGFFNGEAVYRTHATGAEMPTPWNGLPFESADAYKLSEMFLSGRQSRVGFIAEGKTSWGTLRAFVEGDFLGVGTTSNNNQSASYLLRQRVVLAEAETNSHWTFSGGQGWSLVTENKTGITTAPANMALPMMIDPNYVTGLVWARAGNLRVTKSFAKASFAVSAENPQLLYSASLAGNTPYAVVGSAGLSAGLMNQAMSSCSPSTSIVNYTNQAVTASDGATVNIAVPVYKTMNTCANLANVSFNQAPDVVIKAAFDPGFGHFEAFGVGRIFHETVYPGETTNSNLYGGLKDIVTGQTVAPALTTAGAWSNSVDLGGFGESMRIPLLTNRLVLGAKGLYGPGVGHFADSSLPDATSSAIGSLVPIHNASGLFTAEFSPTKRVQLYAYYGGDYAGRADEANSGATTLAAPTAAQNSSGVWGGTWKAPSAAAVGYGSRLLNNASCNTIAAPGYNGSSTGYYPGGSCSAQTRDVQEGTAGYWYDLYKGDRGRLRQGFQFSYAQREAWSGANGVGAKGLESMAFTSLRYFLP